SRSGFTVTIAAPTWGINKTVNYKGIRRPPLKDGEIGRRARFPAGLGVLRYNRGGNAAPDIEARRQPHEARSRGLYQVRKNAIRHRLVESTVVSERPDVELEAFQLDTRAVRHVIQHQRREVRLAGLRAQASKLRY